MPCRKKKPQCVLCSMNMGQTVVVHTAGIPFSRAARETLLSEVNTNTTSVDCQTDGVQDELLHEQMCANCLVSHG